MLHAYPIFRAFCRCAVAALLIKQAVLFFIPSLGPSTITPLGEQFGLILAPYLIAGLCLWAASWLVLGICSRILAVWGLALSFMLVMTTHDSAAFQWHLAEFAAAALFAIPVLFRGGGAFALHARGWNLTA
ncbi:hypothetical protein ACFORG_13925 [Lutimaribacter marinistellae]|uniref:Oxidoreductase n=1 Tax=Lutimaribacter marinistellae TaxID=1820329 RepID=A0ABV7TH28_9RHOB